MKATATTSSRNRKATASRSRVTKKSATRVRAQVAPGTAKLPVIGVLAPAGPAPQVELFLGAERLADEGFSIYLHPQVTKQEQFFAGSDTDRALAFLDYAFDDEIEVLWAARGGYGCVRILPILDEITAQVGIPPKKTLIGFSDNTILLEYVRERWGWRVIHGPMPATQSFERVKGKDWNTLVSLLKSSQPNTHKLKSVYLPPNFVKAQGELVGGNLTMIASVLKTPYEFNLQGKLLFIEDVTEAPYKMDRMMQQLQLSGALSGVRALLLGTFTQCADSVPMVYAEPPGSRKKVPLMPLRPTLSEVEVMRILFGELGETLGIPVFSGLRSGHGEGTEALELGRIVDLTLPGNLIYRP